MKIVMYYEIASWAYTLSRLGIMLLSSGIMGYFLIIKIQNTQRKRFHDLVSQLKPGARITTTQGIAGVVYHVLPKTVTVSLACGKIIELPKQVICHVKTSTE